jgi:hypothetical protein
MVEVVHMRKCNPPWGQPGDVRIDRATKWGNPFPITTAESREMVLLRYEVWLASQIAHKKLDILELKDAKRLGCWCKPRACHGDILKHYLDEKLNSQQRTLV